MSTHSFPIHDDLEVASPVLKRMRLDGLDRAWVPFPEHLFLAWRGKPDPTMKTETLIGVVKVGFRTLPKLRCRFDLAVTVAWASCPEQKRLKATQSLTCFMCTRSR